MRKMTASRSNPDVIHLYSRKHSTGLPAVLSSSFFTRFGNGKQFAGARDRKLIMACEITLVSKKMGKPFLVFSEYQYRIGSFPGVKCSWGVLLTTHPLLVPRSWKSRVIPLPTLWATPGL